MLHSLYFGIILVRYSGYSTVFISEKYYFVSVAIYGGLNHNLNGLSFIGDVKYGVNNVLSLPKAPHSLIPAGCSLPHYQLDLGHFQTVLIFRLITYSLEHCLVCRDSSNCVNRYPFTFTDQLEAIKWYAYVVRYSLHHGGAGPVRL